MSDRPHSLLESVAEEGRPDLVNRDREMIPVVLLRAMLILALSALALTSYAVLTDRPLVGQPLPAPVIQERLIVLDGTRTGMVTIRDLDGAVLVAGEDMVSGFHSVVWRALARSRMQHGIPATAPLLLQEHANGRLGLTDPETGWHVELASFGGDNRHAFAALLDD